MNRDTNPKGKGGTERTNCPTPRPGNIATEPEMIELKRLVNELTPDRRKALDDYLKEPELQAIVNREEGADHGEQNNGTNGGPDPEDQA